MDTHGTVDAILKAKGNAVWSVAPTDTVYEAIQIMADKNVGALMVMEREVLVGVISERDYTRRVALEGKNSRDTAVQDIITDRLFTVAPGTTVEECMHQMVGHRIRHLPVVQNDRVLGVVSIGDLVNWIISSQSAAISQLEAYIAGSYTG